MSMFKLYHNNFSICSIMVRYTLALAGSPVDELSKMVVSEIEIDVMRGGQLNESFLCNVNPKGQVPALTSPSLPTPLTDSLDITSFICTRYPSLLPEAHKKETLQLLKELHSISYFALSFSDKPFVAERNMKAVEDLLARNDISDSYRNALRYKLSGAASEKLAEIQPEFKAQNDIKAAQLLRDFEPHLPSSTPWLFDLLQPTALDAHLITFIARLKEVRRLDLVPDKMLLYAAKAWEGEEWCNTMQGRKTMFGM